MKKSKTVVVMLGVWLCCTGTAAALQPEQSPLDNGALDSVELKKTVCRTIKLREYVTRHRPADAVVEEPAEESPRPARGRRRPRVIDAQEDDVHQDRDEMILLCAKEGVLLHDVLQAWCEASGWQLVWESKYDYLIVAQMVFRGRFDEAISALIDAYETAAHPLKLHLYPKQRVAVVADV